MALMLIYRMFTKFYRMFTKLLFWMVLCARSDATKDIEILVLRHQLAVLQRHTPRPRLQWIDRVVIEPRPAAASTPPPSLGHPSTILRWHRALDAVAGPAWKCGADDLACRVSELGHGV